jgi:hypothetical protein
MNALPHAVVAPAVIAAGECSVLDAAEREPHTAVAAPIEQRVCNAKRVAEQRDVAAENVGGERLVLKSDRRRRGIPVFLQPAGFIRHVGRGQVGLFIGQRGIVDHRLTIGLRRSEFNPRQNRGKATPFPARLVGHVRVQRVTLILPSAFAEDPAAFDGTRLDLRDPDYIREVMPLLEAAYRYYFRVRATGFERTRVDGPFLMVGNHNGGINAPDAAMTLRAINLHVGPERPLYALIHPVIFTYPYLNVHAQKLGGIAATARMTLRAIEAGSPLFIYPGAGDDAYKPPASRCLTASLCSSFVPYSLYLINRVIA